MIPESIINTHTICMSINPKRYEYLCKNFESVGLAKPKLFKGVRWNRGSNTGCVLAHISILNMCKLFKVPHVIIFEDDAYPRPDVLQCWKKICENAPDDCGLLKLGNSSYRGQYKEVNPYMYQMMSGVAYGSHAYYVRYELYDRLIKRMVQINVPDEAMSLEHYRDMYYKPYVLNLDYHLFIQKNINIDNIISCKGGQRYWYPNPIDKTGMTSGKPCKYFSDCLIDDESNYIETISIIRNKQWKRGKKSGVVKDNIIYTKDEDGRLQKTKDNEWNISWSNGCIDKLVFDEEKDGIKFYTILEKGVHDDVH